MTCECGHPYDAHYRVSNRLSEDAWAECDICGCPEYKPRHDPAYDPDDVADQGYQDEGYPYSGLGKVRR